ncbi:hypothetical protein SGFS_094000 [Streptomyces graminofaciens]|uniref:Uncharacterized protein n=1 Tax=Streptomyces graminofaciens TaxID=68212 RepID=A0ABN5VY26_9ACTN|nr:hypothetical protein SGFS_094000 [Streptomyces graminofaciens]
MFGLTTRPPGAGDVRPRPVGILSATAGRPLRRSGRPPAETLLPLHVNASPHPWQASAAWPRCATPYKRRGGCGGGRRQSTPPYTHVPPHCPASHAVSGPPVLQFLRPAALLSASASAGEVRELLTGAPEVSRVLSFGDGGVSALDPHGPPAGRGMSRTP